MRGEESAKRGQFLHYRPRLAFGNEMLTRMLNYHTERVIQIDKIFTPDSRAISPRELRSPIKVCRIIAGMDSTKGAGIGQFFLGLN